MGERTRYVLVTSLISYCNLGIFVFLREKKTSEIYNKDRTGMLEGWKDEEAVLEPVNWFDVGRR
jgi:hypothetical protein